MTTWKNELTAIAASNKEAFEDLIISIAEGELDREFDNGYGGSRGAPFTAWGPNHVYFPIVYDGAEWVGSAPRNPCDIKLAHQGGE